MVRGHPAGLLQSVGRGFTQYDSNKIQQYKIITRTIDASFELKHALVQNIVLK